MVTIRPCDYHDYVISLLRKLGARTGDAGWSETADRFRPTRRSRRCSSSRGHPGDAPRHGSAKFRFWLSKTSTVTLRVGKAVLSGTLGHGSHTFSGAEERRPGTYHPRLTAVPAMGPSIQKALPPVKIAHGKPSTRKPR